MRISVDCIRCEISTKRKCRPSDWNRAAGRMSGKTEEVKAFNAYLDVLQHKVYEAKRNLMELGKTVSAESYSGLAYADVQKLKRSEIVLGIDGEKWIFIKRQKTDVLSRIPLLPVAMQILNQYQDHPQCKFKDRVLPILSNQKMNAYLKEIGDLCGISKNLSYNIARHTFATTITLSNGVPMETVSKMLGHRNLRTSQHYAKILDHKISEDMKVIRLKYCSNL